MTAKLTAKPKRAEQRLWSTHLTTGQAAKLCQVAPRTVSKWCDSGKIRGAYRIPLSSDRRIPRESLIRFLKEHGVPLGGLARVDEYHALAVGLDALTRERLAALLPESEGFHWQWADDAFTAGLALGGQELPPDALLLDLAMGRGEALAIARRLAGRELYRDMAVVALACEDERDDFAASPFSKVCQRPFNLGLLVEHLRGLAGRKLGA